jgi:hypothetical protein
MPAEPKPKLDQFAAMEQHQSGMGKGLKSGGPFDGMDDGRLDKIEIRLSAIEGEQWTHFRWGIGLLVTVAFGLAALIATTSVFMTSRIDRTEDRQVRVEAAIGDRPDKLSSNLNNQQYESDPAPGRNVCEYAAYGSALRAGMEFYRPLVDAPNPAWPESPS